MILIDTLLYAITAILASCSALLFIIIGRILGNTKAWTLISTGFVILTVVRLILIYTNLQGETSIILNLFLLTIAFSFILAGSLWVYKVLSKP